MDESSNLTKNLIEKADDDAEFRARLLANPKAALEQEFDLTVADHHEIHVHEETATETHIVLPPKSKFSREERQEARTGASSLEFLKRTMYDPAPPLRSSSPQQSSFSVQDLTRKELDAAVRESIRRGLAFLSSAVDENGAWHCIRFNLSDPNIPRHYERPAFISAFCALALESSEEPDARALCARTTNHLEDTIEYPGFWRYYRHLPQDLDSTTLSSLVLEPHPWIGLGRNIPRILANRDDEGRFLTWILEDDEPAVVALFRIEADPVVNANTIAYLGDRPETKSCSAMA